MKANYSLFTFILIFFLSANVIFAQNTSNNSIINGQILTEGQDPLRNVFVKLVDENGILVDSTFTNLNGDYSFSRLPDRTSYIVIAEDFGDGNANTWLNGLSTFDIVLLIKGLLGEEDLLENPLTSIAADVNDSGTVTVFDVVLIRQMILGIISAPPSGQSWRFVRSDWTFDLSNIFLALDQAAQARVTTNGSTQVINFIGIKSGDLNGSTVVR